MVGNPAFRSPKPEIFRHRFEVIQDHKNASHCTRLLNWLNKLTYIYILVINATKRVAMLYLQILIQLSEYLVYIKYELCCIAPKLISRSPAPYCTQTLLRLTFTVDFKRLFGSQLLELYARKNINISL